VVVSFELYDQIPVSESASQAQSKLHGFASTRSKGYTLGARYQSLYFLSYQVLDFMLSAIDNGVIRQS